MKILRITTFLDYGGIESKMANLSSLKDKNNEWIFISLGKGGVAEKKIRNNHKKVQVLNLPYRIPSLFTIWKLYKYFRKEKPDVIHASGAEANFHGFFAAKLARVPRIVVEEIGISSYSKKAEFFFKYIFKYADLVIGESEVVTNYISTKFSIPKIKVKTIHNFGIFDCGLPTVESGNMDDCFRILMISRLEPIKNIESVLNVIKRLVKNNVNVHLSIAGKGSLEIKLKERVHQLKISRNVTFLGLITDPYVPLVNADLYVLNSFSEGFSNSLIEAMYSKTPSLSTNVGAAPEIIEQGVNGFLIPPNDEEALFAKINEIILLPSARLREIGVAGNSTMIKKYSLAKHVKELMNIYKCNGS